MLSWFTAPKVHQVWRNQDGRIRVASIEEDKDLGIFFVYVVAENDPGQYNHQWALYCDSRWGWHKRIWIEGRALE